MLLVHVLKLFEIFGWWWVADVNTIKIINWNYKTNISNKLDWDQRYQREKNVNVDKTFKYWG